MELNHTKEIEATRVGGFGGSDAKMFYKIGSKGLESLNNTDKKRISVAKGLIEYKPINQNEAMQRGHDFEDWYEVHGLMSFAEREPKLSTQLAENFDTFFHADFYFDGEVWELKCLANTENAENEYIEQLQWQYLIFADKVWLVVCDSSKEFSEGVTPPEWVKRNEKIIKVLKKGIKLLDEAWETIDLTVGEDWEGADLMFFEQAEVAAMHNYLAEIKSLELKAEAQKEKVLQLMLDNNIKSLKSDYYSITLVPESTAHTFDKKKMLSEHPEIDESKYTESSPKKAYIKVTIK